MAKMTTKATHWQRRYLIVTMRRFHFFSVCDYVNLKVFQLGLDC